MPGFLDHEGIAIKRFPFVFFLHAVASPPSEQRSFVYFAPSRASARRAKNRAAGAMAAGSTVKRG